MPELLISSAFLKMRFRLCDLQLSILLIINFAVVLKRQGSSQSDSSGFGDGDHHDSLLSVHDVSFIIFCFVDKIISYIYISPILTDRDTLFLYHVNGRIYTELVPECIDLWD